MVHKAQYYCKCDEFFSCENYVRHHVFCCICHIVDLYTASDFEKIKYNPRKLFDLAKELFNDIKKCYEFDKNLKFWNKDFQFKWEEFMG